MIHTGVGVPSLNSDQWELVGQVEFFDHISENYINNYTYVNISHNKQRIRIEKIK